jgi:hypothetical protein
MSCNSRSSNSKLFQLIIASPAFRVMRGGGGGGGGGESITRELHFHFLLNYGNFFF